MLLALNCNSQKIKAPVNEILVGECVKGPVRNGKLLALDSTKITDFIARHSESAFWKSRLCR